MIINTNLSAQSAASNLMASSNALAKSLQRLSSGSKITSPADDSAGLGVSMRLSAEINRVGAASDNIGNALSFKQTQDSYLQQVGAAFSRMDELAMQAQDVTKTDADRVLLNQEFQSLGFFVLDVANKTFNGVSLFSTQSLSVTADSEGGTFTTTGINLNALTYTRAATNNILTSNPNSTQAHNTMIDVENAIKQVAHDRAQIGADIESLGYYHDQLSALNNNLTAANSRIMDVDVAQESTQYARENILVQSGTAMLAQANSLPNSVLKLLS
jgi:flagellin